MVQIGDPLHPSLPEVVEGRLRLLASSMNDAEGERGSFEDADDVCRQWLHRLCAEKGPQEALKVLRTAQVWRGGNLSAAVMFQMKGNGYDYKGLTAEIKNRLSYEVEDVPRCGCNVEDDGSPV